MFPTAAGRKLVIRIIEAVDKGGQLQQTLNEELLAKPLARHEAAACTDLLYSFFRSRVAVEWLLGQFLKNPSKLPSKAFIHMTLALVALFYQDKGADYAIVSETVSAIKKDFGKSLAGVANGVLRSILREERQVRSLTWHEQTVDEKDPFWGRAVFYGIPREIAALWRNSYGSENAELLMARSARRPWKGLLVNSLHPDRDTLRNFFSQIASEHIKSVGEWGVAVAPGAMPSEICARPLAEWVREGAIVLQAAGSQLVLKELGVDKWQEPVWDCCAGVGGKARILANLGVNVLLASDISAKRGTAFFSLSSKWFKTIPYYALMDAARPALNDWAGNIVADVPCSGLGVLARRPDLRNISGRLQTTLFSLNELQQSLFRSLARILRQGRQLVWITCTLNPAENQGLLARMLKEFPSCKIIREWQTPHDHPWLEGMYGAVLLKG